MRSPSSDERGVALLEFALVVPTLLALILGIVDFGDRYKSAAMYNHYASVAARSMTIDNSAATAKTVAVGAGMPSSLTPTITFTAGYASCAPLADGTYGNVFVTIRNPAKATLTRFFGATYSVTGTAVARCNGS